MFHLGDQFQDYTIFVDVRDTLRVKTGTNNGSTEG